MKIASILLFLLVVVFGIIRLRVPGQMHVERAQAKVQVLSRLEEKNKLLPHRSPEVSSSIDAEKQAAQKEAASAQQNISMLQIIQIVLTVLAIILCAVVLRMVLTGKPVSGVATTFAFGSMTTIIAYWFYVPKG